MYLHLNFIQRYIEYLQSILNFEHILIKISLERDT